jgi:hypothetical protein
MEYIMKNVTPTEFMTLKTEETAIVAYVRDGFNDVWKPKLQDIDVSFKYNKDKSFIGIFVNRGEKQQLALESRELSENENIVVSNLYKAMEERLSKIREMPGNWVDSV